MVWSPITTPYILLGVFQTSNGWVCGVCRARCFSIVSSAHA